ncbi:tRNA guanosine(34) transglycosylase Tgt [Prosthecobacter fluviatilis]|uniref:Queuine tRNA-ribosyltransferase n=1 Tax=Prosthecobacter fluviatilis TaxID=445931 RepID=A0ABW0KSJ5_9BACT
MSPSRLQFQLDAQASGSRARATTFRTLHGTIQSPLFMPVGTQATVKAQTQETLHESGSQILLANTYHLLLRPGPEVFKKLGGIHKFMRWPGSVLTDSGGYQIFSLPHSREMTEKGAVFQSYVDGQRILLSPELSIQMQRAIGSDIMMVLDQCIPSTADEQAASAALQITRRWAARSLAAREDSPQSMFGIVQGALYPQLRRESAEGLMELDFDGFAIGGLAVGEEKNEREDVCELTAALLPSDRPRYLMGVGTPLDVLEAVHRGVDMFDCIIPTQVAKRGTAFTSRGIVELRRSVYKFSEDRLDPSCTCPVCATHTRAYLHHLTKTQEPLGWTLVGQHNIHFYHQLMREVRQSILEDRFLPLYKERREILPIEDVDHPVTPPKRTSTKVEHVGDYELCGDPPTIRHSATARIVCTTPQLDATTESQIIQHLRLPADSPPLVVWDTHLSAAATALGVILLYEAEAAKGPVRPLHLVSFSDDLSPLRLALHHKRHFPYLRHGAADTLIRRDVWESRYCVGLKWTLVQDNAGEGPAPDVVVESTREPLAGEGSS